MAADRLAPVLLVFGNGVRPAPALGEPAAGAGPATGCYELTAGSLARVRAAADHVAGGGAPSRIILTGGWAGAREGAAAPPDGCREGDLMLAAAREAGLDRHAELRTECRSRSTLENLLNIVEDGLLTGFTFDAATPLGLVTHHWHLPRVRFLAGKVLGLHGAALLPVPATGERGSLYEYAVRAASRVGFAGVRDAATLLRRERRLMAWMRRRTNGV